MESLWWTLGIDSSSVPTGSWRCTKEEASQATLANGWGVSAIWSYSRAAFRIVCKPKTISSWKSAHFSKTRTHPKLPAPSTFSIQRQMAATGSIARISRILRPGLSVTCLTRFVADLRSITRTLPSKSGIPSTSAGAPSFVSNVQCMEPHTARESRRRFQRSLVWARAEGKAAPGNAARAEAFVLATVNLKRRCTAETQRPTMNRRAAHRTSDAEKPEARISRV